MPSAPSLGDAGLRRAQDQVGVEAFCQFSKPELIVVQQPWKVQSCLWKEPESEESRPDPEWRGLQCAGGQSGGTGYGGAEPVGTDQDEPLGSGVMNSYRRGLIVPHTGWGQG